MQFFVFFVINQFVFVLEIIIKYRIAVYSFSSNCTYTQQQHSKYLQNTSFAHLCPKYQRLTSFRTTPSRAPLTCSITYIHIVAVVNMCVCIYIYVYVCLSAMKFRSYPLPLRLLLLQSSLWMCLLIFATAVAAAVAVYRIPSDVLLSDYGFIEQHWQHLYSVIDVNDA